MLFCSYFFSALFSFHMVMQFLFILLLLSLFIKYTFADLLGRNDYSFGKKNNFISLWNICVFFLCSVWGWIRLKKITDHQLLLDLILLPIFNCFSNIKMNEWLNEDQFNGKKKRSFWVIGEWTAQQYNKAVLLCRLSLGLGWETCHSA